MIMKLGGIAALVVAAAMAWPPVWSAESVPLSAEAREVEAPRDLSTTLERFRVEHGVPAVGCVVVYSNRVVALGVSGVRKHGVAEAVTIGDKWHHGSLTKSMTASLAALLVEEGKVAWTTTVGSVFGGNTPDLHPEWRDVTLELLLANRGGALGDLKGKEAGMIWEKIWDHPGTPVEQRRTLVHEVITRPPEVSPGTGYVYSNAGFAIAGSMLETVMGVPWEKLLQERLFIPLNMSSGGFGVPASPRYINQPWGHRFVDDVLRPIAPGIAADNPPAIGPAGTVHCSLEDMARYVAWHLAGLRGEAKLLNAASFKKLHTALDGQSYALGWQRTERRWAGGMASHHTGSNTQWYTNVWLAPEKDWGAVVVTNVGGERAFALTDAIVAAMIGEFLTLAQ